MSERERERERERDRKKEERDKENMNVTKAKPVHFIMMPKRLKQSNKNVITVKRITEGLRATLC